MECPGLLSTPALQRACRPPSPLFYPPSQCASFSFKGAPFTRPHLPLSLRASPSVKVFASVPAQPTVSNSETSKVVPPKSVSVILLAGGTGKRMGANMPKQYLPLLGQPIALHSFHTFASMDEVNEIVVVCDPSYRDIFEDAGKSKPTVELKFAPPGKERQFSVYNGLKEICKSAKLTCVHDSARPLVLTKDIRKVLLDAYIHGAAVLGVPVKGTIKEVPSLHLTWSLVFS